MMVKKKVAPGAAAGKNAPPKKKRRLRRFFLWLFLLMIVAGGIAAAGVYFNLIPVDPELLAKAQPYLAKVGIHLKPAEEAVAGETPQTNFPLVDLEQAKKDAAAAKTAPAADILGKPSVAAASPTQGLPVDGKPPAPVKESADMAKVYNKLSKLYGAMKPEEAVAVFNNLEDEQVILILARMEEEAAAKVLSALEPKRAARLTQAMIKRK